MKYLLDTHVWIWAMEDPQRLPHNIQRELFQAGNLPIGLSVISAWEVSKKESIGKLKLSVPVRQWLASAIQEPFIALQPLSVDIAHESNQLPGEFHRDPADQIIVATARLHGLTLITADRRILSYPRVLSMWA
ncbi:MAG: type II toxin-antitoxin system VapC family toxin [Kiritimatiellia bacterium]|jgi:PIN domain nuclease of toxin-antitoxin system|nr:type II toxin-antitoxin system VapC family toxin [Kiritimatiellia bacterium]